MKKISLIISAAICLAASSAKAEYSPHPAELAVVMFVGAVPPWPTVMRYVVLVVTAYDWL